MRNSKSPTEKTYRHTLAFQLIICAVILISLSLLKVSPDDVFVKAKKAVSLILTQQTDIKEEIRKIKEMFVTDENLNALTPVSDFVNPANGATVTKRFGVQDAEESGFHYGVDLKLENNQNVVSAAKGEISEIATNQEYGSYIVIKHSDEISTLYAHLNEILPDIGATVEAGQAIARANGENNTIHFEIKKGDTYLDPSEFIDFGEQND